MAALLAGQRVSEIAETHNIPQQTVSRWKEALASEGVFGSGENGCKNRVSELVGEYLIEALETLRDQAKTFRDRDFLNGQPASEAAVLHGVIMDKVIRILEAAERADARQQGALPE